MATMDVKTHALDRVLEALAPSIASEIDRVIQETRETIEKEFRDRVESAVREAESTAASAAQAQIERAVAEAKEEMRQQVAAEVEQQLREKVEAATAQLKNEAAEERTKLEAALVQQKNEWSGELNKVEDERDRWRIFAQTQRQLAEASSQSEMLSRFLAVAYPYANGLAIYLAKPDGLALWQSKGNEAFPKIISKETTDPDSYFKIISVRGKVVGAICAVTSFHAESLDFLVGSLERAIEAFAVKLRAPNPNSAAADSR